MRFKLRLISSAMALSLISVLLVIAITYEFSSLAWFANNGQVDGTTGISVQRDGVVESVKYYRVTDVMITRDENDVKHNVYKFGFDPSVLSSQLIEQTAQDGSVIYVQERESFDIPIDMLPYSDLSGDCQVLLEIDLSVDGPIELSTELFSSAYLADVIRDKIDGGLYDLEPQGLPLSSVIRFAVFDDLEVDDRTDSYLVSEDDIVARQLSFVSVEEVDEVEQFSFGNVLSAPSSIEPTDRKIFIFADYYNVSVEHINEAVMEYVDAAEKSATANGGDYNTIVIGETNLVFISDFKFVVSSKED